MHTEPAIRTTRVVRHQLVDDDALSGERREALRDAEVYRANGVGVGERCRRERTCTEH
jgi:hypothetical protein